MNQSSESSLLWFAATLGLILLSFLIDGCATQGVSSVWTRDEIVVDGSMSEWRQPPQHYDKDRAVTLRVGNWNEAIYF